MPRTKLACLLLLTLLLGRPALADDATGWEVDLQPAIWLPTQSLSLSYGDRSIGTTITPSDIRGDFQFGATGRVEARHGDWGVEGEGFYINLARDTSFRRTSGSLRVNQLIVQGAGLYRVHSGEVPVDVVFGVRHYDFNVSTAFRRDGILFPQEYENKRNLNWTDPLVGVRASFPLGEDVRFGLYGDLGGFGLGSDLSWRASGVFDWQVADWASLDLGYAALGADYRRGSGFDTTTFDMTMYGPILGATFHL